MKQEYTPQSNPIIVYRYIHKNGNYSVEKTINGEHFSFGSFNNLADAVHERDLLEKVGWDIGLAVEYEYTPPTFTEEDLPPFPMKQNSRRRLRKGKNKFYGACYVTKRIKPWKRVWRSVITINGKKTSLGYFNDPLSAELVYLETKKEIAGII